MHTGGLTDAIAVTCAVLAIAGSVQAFAAARLVRRFVARLAAPRDVTVPPVTVLKPLHGDEPMLEAALETFCMQDHPAMQIVFGVQREDDPAIAVVERLLARYPDLDATLVIDGTRHGPNRKVDNLINMRAHARHRTLVISDADIHAGPDLIRAVVEPLADPTVGLTTTLYTGLPASRRLCRLLGAAQINQIFLPGVLVGRAMGREDCLGAVMALSADTLDALGGLHELSPHLADDAVLGRKVRELGLHVALARSIPATSVVENTIGELYSHELRWGRTVRGQAPVGYPMSILQAPIAWATLALVASGFSAGGFTFMGCVWLLRALLGRDSERALCGRVLTPIWIAPLRDLLSVAIILISHAGGGVAWRGQRLHISAERNLRAETGPPTLVAAKPVTSTTLAMERSLWRSAN
jgi:ceramide glucosyltransferase